MLSSDFSEANLNKSKRNHSPQLDKKIAAYAIAGAAALVAPAAHASIILTTVNTTVNGTDAGAFYNLNLSGPSSDDITLEAITNANGIIATDNDASATANGATAILMNGFFPSALNSGDAIGAASTTWGTGGKLADTNSKLGAGGNWPTGNNPAYLGFSFEDVSSNTYYGWAQIIASSDGSSSSFTLLDYAYQSTANTTIDAGDTGANVPEPSTLALMGLGAIGLAALRRRRTVTA
jgi:hypothetical protein